MAAVTDGDARWSQRASTLCTIAGAACLWAWGYVANLSTALFPARDVVGSIGIEYAYYVSQLTLLVLGGSIVVVLHRCQPRLAPGAVVAGAVVLSLATLAVLAMVRLPAVPLPAIMACGVAYGVGGVALAVA